MVYGFTIPQNATLPPHPKGAAAFGRFLLSPEGQAILKRNGQGVIAPPVIDGNASILEGS
jgi:molybdate/tungstate transport system substrate-binding protein